MLEILDTDYKGSCIYCIYSDDDSKMYFGRTVEYKKRAAHHLRRLEVGKHHNQYLQRAFKNKKLKIAPVLVCDENQLDQQEMFFISLFKTTDSSEGYNLAKGGPGNPMVRESRLKLSKSLKGKTSWNKGKKTSKEVKEKLSEAKKGVKCYLYDRTGEAHPTTKPVICLTTGVVYMGGVSEAARDLGLNAAHITSVIKGRFDTVGKRKYPGGLVFDYYDNKKSIAA